MSVSDVQRIDSIIICILRRLPWSAFLTTWPFIFISAKGLYLSDLSSVKSYPKHHTESEIFSSCSEQVLVIPL